MTLANAEYFAQGECRNVFKGTFEGGGRDGQHGVYKVFKDGHRYLASSFSMDLAVTDKAGDIIAAFNQEMRSNKEVRLNKPEQWHFRECVNVDGATRKCLVEPFLHGTFEKFNSNTGFVQPDTEYLQALSHFSWWYCEQECLLCDLQGIRDKLGYLLTDPVLMSQSKTYGSTDLGYSGILDFLHRPQSGHGIGGDSPPAGTGSRALRGSLPLQSAW